MVHTARALCRMGKYRACAELLRPVLRAQPNLPGASGVLGIALGSLGDLENAVRLLERAVEEAPGDSGVRASLLSAYLASGAIPEAVDAPGTGALEELAGAAFWLRAQAALRAGDAAAAGRRFGEASALLRRGSPPEVRSERLAACYVGQAVSHLVAGQLDPARQGFGRLGLRESASEPVQRFARQVYEIAGLLEELEPEERAAAVGPLVELVLRVRLRTAFYSGEGAVVLAWDLG